MPTLRELQQGFRRALLAGADDEPDRTLQTEVLGDGLTPGARVGIYRHHVLTTLTAVLKDTYPVVCRLVGRGFFGYAADRFIRSHPPAGPCLFEYGADVADFLADFPPCRDLAYLPDVARLEWAMHRALHAETVGPLDPRALRDVSPEQTAALRLRLHPSLTLLASPWPVEGIWRANQPEANPDATVDLDTGGARLEVRRVGDDAVFRTLAPAGHAFRAALAAGRSLEAAAAAALAIDPGFDLAGALHALLDEALVVGFDR